MVRKCRPVAEFAIMDVGVRTRSARAMAMTAAKASMKKRKFNDSEFSIASSSYIQLRSRRIAVQISKERRQLSASSDRDVSCCSSSGSGERTSGRIELADLKDESFEAETSTYYSCNEREETTPCEVQAELDDMDSTSRPPAAESRRRSTVEKMPTEAELEEFFAAAEKKIQKQFAEKYNYDIVKDEPLEGRYEWVRLNP